uniref:Uncharacterized protein n=1 Tax=Parascaris univalens TaxID=6257 RepID=A0A915A9B1_PARUN
MKRWVIFSSTALKDWLRFGDIPRFLSRLNSVLNQFAFLKCSLNFETRKEMRGKSS